ncbi:TetR/AcrR family transcriptional regulator [Gordonia sp. ABSL1-1]|uniref:TetR/AcrR family transcriptional regulator n=1 Tax=Gordonia sp. ABSL1-1 TaxID=3053923 RepID=UPI0025748804|nr:TetR/AcrR family transcriptional regulator [Gordonia sp. ABSL1-1]MDL9937578.1 TetR/AcrR family transcriptional regulator [Gordonia sp. ABSL1-1]
MTPSDAVKLTLPAIVDAAIAVADRDGIGGLSMRRIADEIGVGAMSLYRHVADKDALVVAMAEELGRRFSYPEEGSGDWTWHDRVRIAVDIDWELYRQHPWVVFAYAAPRYSFGTESLDGLEWLAAGFLDLGVDATRATEMALTVWNHVNGVALAGASEQLLNSEPSRDHTSGLAEVIAGRVASARPTLGRLADDPAAGRLTDPRAILDAGIAALCAGFEAEARGT